MDSIDNRLLEIVGALGIDLLPDVIDFFDMVDFLGLDKGDGSTDLADGTDGTNESDPDDLLFPLL
jgi:hypothetical protein